MIKCRGKDTGNRMLCEHEQCVCDCENIQDQIQCEFDTEGYEGSNIGGGILLQNAMAIAEQADNRITALEFALREIRALNFEMNGLSDAKVIAANALNEA